MGPLPPLVQKPKQKLQHEILLDDEFDSNFGSNYKNHGNDSVEEQTVKAKEPAQSMPSASEQLESEQRK